MKKVLVSLLLLVVMIFNIFALAGCDIAGIIGGGGKDEDLEGKTVINFYHTMGENLRTVLDEYIIEFNKLYPDIVIKHEQVGGYDDVREQIATELTVGGQPNIAYCYPDHVALYNLAYAVKTLDELIDSKEVITRADGTTEILGLTDEQKADFISAYYEEGRQFGDGLMYTMPLSKSTEVLYYNKTFFDKHGLEVPKTWDELEALCKKIKDELDPGSIPLGYDSEANWFITMTEQLGTPYTSANEINGTHFHFNTPENRAFVERFRGWYQNGWVTTQEIYGAYTSALFVGTDKDGIRSYMSIGSSAGANHQTPKDGSFEVGIAPIPQANPDKPKVISQGPSLCIFDTTGKNPDKHITDEEVKASWLFVKFLVTNVAFQADFSIASGYVPVIKSVNNDEYYKEEFLDKANGYAYTAALSVKVCLEQADAYYTSPAFNGSSTARDEVGELLQACLAFDAKEYPNAAKRIEELFGEAIDDCEYDQ